MIKANRKRGTKGGIIIPKDKFKEFVEFQRRWVEGKSRRRWFIQGDVYTKYFRYTAKLEVYAKYCGYNEVI